MLQASTVVDKVFSHCVARVDNVLSRHRHELEKTCKFSTFVCLAENLLEGGQVLVKHTRVSMRVPTRQPFTGLVSSQALFNQ